MSARFKFPVRSDHRFLLNGRWYRITYDGVEVIRLLAQLYDAHKASDRITWALPWRHIIRRIEALNARATLSLVIETSSDRRMRLLAIWLRGRCGGYTGAPNVARHLNDPEYQVRKEAIRALKRIHGWGFLQSALASEQDDRLRRLAISRPPRPYRSRLTAFARNVHALPLSRRLTNYWISDDVRLGEGKPPKSLWTIRQILLRIRSLVHQ